MSVTPKYKIGDRFVTHGRGYKEIWEICTRTFNPYQGEHTYDLVSIRISPGHEIFDLSTLLQICGRVGRKAKYNNGDIYFLATKQKNTLKKCIQQVERYNENL